MVIILSVGNLLLWNDHFNYLVNIYKRKKDACASFFLTKFFQLNQRGLGAYNLDEIVQIGAD